MVAPQHDVPGEGFNPRPREGAAGRGLGCARRGQVSIRAPVRGRRSLISQMISVTEFQSAPP